MTSTITPAVYDIRPYSPYGQPDPAAYVVTFTVAGTMGPVGEVIVRVHGSDRASIRAESLTCNGRQYRAHIAYDLADGEWAAESDHGSPSVYHADSPRWFQRPAPTIDRRLRDALAGALSAVLDRAPMACADAEVTRTEREYLSAESTVDKLRVELATAEAALNFARIALDIARAAADR